MICRPMILSLLTIIVWLRSNVRVSFPPHHFISDMNLRSRALVQNGTLTLLIDPGFGARFWRIESPVNSLVARGLRTSSGFRLRARTTDSFL